MLILAIDTSGPSCGVALHREGLLCYEATVNNRLTHSVNLMPMVDEAFKRSGTKVEDVDLFAAVIGPGSFTGVRIGVSAIKAMAFACEKPCIGINALEALALGCAETGHLVCPIRDARVQQVYGAVYQCGNRLMEDEAIKIDELMERLPAFGETTLFVGDGARVYQAVIAERMGKHAVFAPPHLSELKAGAAAAIAYARRGEAIHHHELEPLYLRAPQAERMRAQKEVAHG